MSNKFSFFHNGAEYESDVWTVDGDDYYCRLPHDEKISDKCVSVRVGRDGEVVVLRETFLSKNLPIDLPVAKVVGTNGQSSLVTPSLEIGAVDDLFIRSMSDNITQIILNDWSVQHLHKATSVLNWASAYKQSAETHNGKVEAQLDEQASDMVMLGLNVLHVSV